MRFAVLVVVAACSSSAKQAPPAAGSPFERFATATPKVGELAPAFELADANGTRVKLADAVARGPVVLVWGSFT